MKLAKVIDVFTAAFFVVFVVFFVASVIVLIGSEFWVLWTQPFDHPVFAWWIPKLLVTDILLISLAVVGIIVTECWS